MKYPKLRELKEAIRALIKGPYTSKFPRKPHVPYEAFRGRPEFHESDCIGCAACVNVCPTNALSFEDKIAPGSVRRVLNHKVDLCIFCGHCQTNCPTEKGIVLSREFDLATTEKREDLQQTIEKEFVVCDCCGEPVAPRDQISWVAAKLGPLVFSNASLMLFYLSQARLAENVLKKAAAKNAEFRRQDRIRVLCPRCRREAVLKS